MPTLSTTLGKNMQLKAQFGHKSRPAGGNFGLKSDNGGRTWSKIGSLPNTATGSVSQIVLGAALLEG